MVEINDLPPELLQEILSYLSIEERFHCERVCHQWQQNVFSLIKNLSFEKFEDVFHGFHKHVFSTTNLLLCKTDKQDHVQKCVILKCGRNIRWFRGFASPSVLQGITQFCPFLHCVDIRVDNVDTLKVLSEKHGEQLTCVTLRVDKNCNISQFLIKCSNITSLAVVSPVSSYSSQMDFPPCTVNLVDINKAHPNCLNSIQNLVIAMYITNASLQQLMMFSALEMVSLTSIQNSISDIQWTSLMKSWCGLKALVLHSDCFNLRNLPPYLEYLSLHLDVLCHSIIEISTYLPKLKTLVVCGDLLSPDNLSEFLESVFCCCPAVENLSIDFCNRYHVNNDQILAPLVSLTSLKHLSLGSEFIVSDSFASELMVKLEHLTSFGKTPFVRHECNCVIPAGEFFWNVAKRKAASHPTEQFTFIGKTNDTLHLQEPFPPNMSLVLTKSATIKLGRRFGTSTQWQKWTSLWSELLGLSLVIVDVGFNLSGLPKNLEILIIVGLNEKACGVNDALTFNILLPKLKELMICQENMSNSELKTILHCAATCCPALKILCVTRGNKDKNPADNCLASLFQCKCLHTICVNENIIVSDQFSAYVVSQLPTLRKYGCGCHKVGFTCGYLFVDALVRKTREGRRIDLKGGPPKLQIQELMNPLKIPSLLYIHDY